MFSESTTQQTGRFTLDSTERQPTLGVKTRVRYVLLDEVENTLSCGGLLRNDNPLMGGGICR